jgi:hypothetical protein
VLSMLSDFRKERVQAAHSRSSRPVKT